MIRKPCRKSVQAVATNPPTKLYRTKTNVMATTIPFTGTWPPAAWLITLAAPFSILALLMVKKTRAKTV